MVLRYKTLALLDSLFAGFVVGPLTAAYWRGTWGLMDLYIFPQNREHSLWVSFAIGALPLYLLVLFNHKLTEYFQDKSLVRFLVVRVYTYIFGFVNVNLWRSVWSGWNFYTGTGSISCGVSILIGWGTMAALRVSKNHQAPPVAVAVDTGPDVFVCSTRFKTLPSDREKYILDHLFTHFFMACVVVFAWRGLWVLLDNVLFPNSAEWSAWWSLGIGYGVYFLCVLLQWPLLHLGRCLENRFLFKLMVEDIFFFFANASAICVWRGVWMCCDIYIWPQNLSNSCLLTHGVGLGVLMLVLCGESVLVRGCLVDGELKDGGGMMLNNCYLRHYFSSCEENVEISTQDKSKDVTLKFIEEEGLSLKIPDDTYNNQQTEDS